MLKTNTKTLFKKYNHNIKKDPSYIQTCIAIVLHVLSADIRIVLDIRRTCEVSSSFLLEYLVHVDQFLSVFQCTRLEKVFECFFHPLVGR